MWMIVRIGWLVVFLSACTSSPQQPEPGERLAACGSFPNCVTSSVQQGDSAVDPLSATPDQWQALLSQLRETKNWSVTIEEDNFFQAVVATPLMRFRDDVQLQYDPALQLIEVRSSSRLGYSDMGVNRERIESLRRSLDALQSAP